MTEWKPRSKRSSQVEGGPERRAKMNPTWKSTQYSVKLGKKNNIQLSVNSYYSA